MNSKETRRNRSTFETTMRAVLQWFGFAAFLFSASLLFLKMGFYELSVSSTCSRDVSSSYKVVEMEVTCVLSQVISLLMPNPCGGGKNLCLISPTLKTRGEPPVPELKEMFEKCNFFDEKLNDIDCSVERDTRDYVGKNHSLKLTMSVLGRHIAKSDTVLELGGRYATTTCAIALQQDNSGEHFKTFLTSEEKRTEKEV